MSCAQLPEGGFQVVCAPWLAIPVIQSCQSPMWTWLLVANYNYIYIVGGEACGRRHMHTLRNENRLERCIAAGKGTRMWGERFSSIGGCTSLT